MGKAASCVVLVAASRASIYIYIYIYISIYISIDL